MQFRNVCLVLAALLSVSLTCSALTCNPGYFPNVVFKYCEPCFWGHYCPDGSRSLPCRDGYYSSSTGAVSCTKCPDHTATDYAHSFCFPTLQNTTSISTVKIEKALKLPVELEAGKTSYVYTTSMVDKRTKCVVTGVSYDTDVPELDATVFVENDGSTKSLIQLSKFKTESLKKGSVNAHFAILDIDASTFADPEYFYFKIDSTVNASKVYLKVDHFVPDDQVVELKNGTAVIKLAYSIDSRFFLDLDTTVDAVLIYLSIKEPVIYASFSNEYPTSDFHDIVSHDGMLKITKDQIPSAPSRLHIAIDETQETYENVKITTIVNPQTRPKQIVFNN